jgi:hypothetical protein
MKVAAIVILLLGGIALQTASGLDILSFNIRRFGPSKLEKQNVIDTIIKIVKPYDVVLIMELVDRTQTVLPEFVDQLNSATARDGVQFNFSVSQRVGRSTQKEQYAFLYRIDTVRILDTYQYPDIDDMFERPPYAILVSSITDRDLPPFFIIASHTRPDSAYMEIDHLDDVFNSVTKAFLTSHGMIAGDLNADGSYVTSTEYDMLDLVINSSFSWWINNSIDTTTTTTDNAYDRIITYKTLSQYVVNGSARVVLFDVLFGLNSDEVCVNYTL